MPKKKILVTVKTYPTLSKKYDELVCTAGFDEQGNWIRLYPIPFRKLEYGSRYQKYTWIELDVQKNTSDFRPERYRPVNVDEIKIGRNLKADGGPWHERRKIVLKKVYTSLETLFEEAKDKKKGTSLAVFKPNEILDFTYEEVEREWDSETLEYIRIKGLQKDLFRNSENPFEVVKKLPYKFSYTLKDYNNRKSTMMIEDWEIGQLFWNSLNSKNDEKLACEDVKKKYYNDFAKTKDLYLFLGTTRQFHNISLNPFIIIGTFHPKHIEQPLLDF